MNRMRLVLAAMAGTMTLTAVGCRTCGDRYSSRSHDRDDRYCATSRDHRDGRLAAMPGCNDPVVTGFGQPGATFSDGAIVGTLPGMGTPFPTRPENELPFPQTIPSPGVPVVPPLTGYGRAGMEMRLQK